MMAWPNQDRVRAAFKDLDLLVHIDLFRNETSLYADYLLPAATGIEKGEISRASEDRASSGLTKFYRHRAMPSPMTGSGLNLASGSDSMM